MAIERADHQTGAELLNIVRGALRFLDAAIVERPMPVVHSVAGHHSWYDIDQNEIWLAEKAGKNALAHELAHSQQEHSAPVAYRRADGSINAALWMAEQREQEAVAVETLAALMALPNWCVCAAAIEAAGIVGCRRAAWAAWLMSSAGNDAKPDPLPRQKRRAMNAARIVCQAPTAGA